MSARRRAGGTERPSTAGDTNAPRGGDASTRRGAPKLLHYVYLNLAVGFFLIVQAAILARSLGSSQTVILFTAILALGFLAVSLFDYLWLRSRN
jgi:hypothetical protein